MLIVSIGDAEDLLGIPAEVDAVELRLDQMQCDLQTAPALPTILTCRREDQGGLFQGSEKQRLQALGRNMIGSNHLVQ